VSVANSHDFRKTTLETYILKQVEMYTIQRWMWKWQYIGCRGSYLNNILTIELKLFVNSTFFFIQGLPHDLTSFMSFVLMIEAHVLIQECFTHFSKAHFLKQESGVESSTHPLYKKKFSKFTK
jgi:hypothetical protein